MPSPVDNLVYNLQRDASCLPQNIFKSGSFYLLLRSFLISGCDFRNHRPLAQQTPVVLFSFKYSPMLGEHAY